MTTNRRKDIVAFGLATLIVITLAGLTWLGAHYQNVAGPIAVVVAVGVFIALFGMAIRSRM